jgi:hypothetical protein
LAVPPLVAQPRQASRPRNSVEAERPGALPAPAQQGVRLVALVRCPELLPELVALPPPKVSPVPAPPEAR